MGGLALLILATSAAQHALVVGLLFAAAASVVAVRNWKGGLTVTAHEVVIRNVTRTLRLSLADVADVSFAPGSALGGGWGYIRVRTQAGAEVRVTSLRRAPLEGAALALAIKNDVAARIAAA